MYAALRAQYGLPSDTTRGAAGQPQRPGPTPGSSAREPTAHSSSSNYPSPAAGPANNNNSGYPQAPWRSRPSTPANAVAPPSFVGGPAPNASGGNAWRDAFLSGGGATYAPMAAEPLVAASPAPRERASDDFAAALEDYGDNNDGHGDDDDAREGVRAESAAAVAAAVARQRAEAARVQRWLGRARAHEIELRSAHRRTPGLVGGRAGAFYAVSPLPDHWSSDVARRIDARTAVPRGTPPAQRIAAAALRARSAGTSAGAQRRPAVARPAVGPARDAPGESARWFRTPSPKFGVRTTGVRETSQETPGPGAYALPSTFDWWR